MNTVAQYREFAADCRRLAERLTAPDDRRALEMMAHAWETVADDLEAKLRKQESELKAG